MRYRLAELAERLGGRVEGDGARLLSGVASLREAGPDDVSFVLSPKYHREAAASAAGALLVGPGWEDMASSGRGLLVIEDPELARNRLLALFDPATAAIPGVHPTAVIEAGATIAASATVGAYAVVGAAAAIGEEAVVGAHVVVGAGCRVGRRVVLHPHVVLYPRTELGDGVEVHAGSVLGADGFGYVSRADGHHKVPQIGRVVVEAGVEVGALSAIDRATVGATRVGEGTKIDNLVQVGHNVEIGRDSLLCGQAGVAGSTRLGERVVLAGQAGVGGHLELGNDVTVGAASAAVRPVAAGTTVSATIPAMEIGRWRRQAALLGRLDELFRRLRRLERGEARASGKDLTDVEEET